jgi:ERCC4-related helicase
MIQRRGRVGRAKEGEVIILISKGTRDEIAKYISIAKERKMRRMMKGMSTKNKTKNTREKEMNIKSKSEIIKSKLDLNDEKKETKQPTLLEFIDEI